VNRECRRFSYIVASVASVVDILVIIFALIGVVVNYSFVRFMSIEIAILFSIVADLYADKCRNVTAAFLYVISTLIALNAVFYSPRPCDLLVVCVNV
jgi:hypothetical protein